jgi:hypothetical protein
VKNEPDFRELVGDEAADDERLRRVHDLLVAAGPPAEMSARVTSPPDVEHSKVLEFKRRRPATLLAVGIAAAAAAFVIGYGIGQRQNSFPEQLAIPMHGVGVANKAAEAEIKVGSHDNGGNYPLQMQVKGLPDAPKGAWYELLLSNHGKPTLSCGIFSVDGGETTVRLSVPYDLPDWHQKKLYDGWVVVLHRHGLKSAPVVMTTAKTA